MPRNSSISSFSPCRTQRRAERSDGPIEDLRFLPDVLHVHFAPRKAEAIVDRFFGIKVNDHILSRVYIMEGGFAVRVETSQSPDGIHFRVKTELLVVGIGW